MESLDRLHNQLDSLGQLRDIVKTMKALSAASIRQYEQAVTSLTDYYRTIEMGLHVVLREMAIPPEAHAPRHAPQRLGAIVFGSDHGLCGRFNEEIAEHAVQQLQHSNVPAEQRRILAVGARVAASLEHAGQFVEEDFLLPGAVPQITATVQQILLKAEEWRGQSNVQSIYLFYNQPTSRGHYRPSTLKLLPVDRRRFEELQSLPWPSNRLPTFSMAREKLFSRLLRQYLFVSLFRACAESQASEHASRLSSMQSAQQNLDERIDEVTMTLRRTRQSLITAELLDVISGYEATAALDARDKKRNR